MIKTNFLWQFSLPYYWVLHLADSSAVQKNQAKALI
jgi:hypothetical protein